MFKLHTEGTVDWAVRMVRPIEDWLNFSCPIVPRSWLDNERERRWSAEVDLWAADKMFCEDISRLADGIDSQSMFAVVTALEVDDTLKSERVSIKLIPYDHNYLLADAYQGVVMELSEYGIGAIARHFTKLATEHIHQNIVDSLEEMQMQKAAA